MYLPVIEVLAMPMPHEPAGIYYDVTTDQVWFKQQAMSPLYCGNGLQLGLIKDPPKPEKQSTGITEQTLLQALAISLKPELGANLFESLKEKG
jgi:hypothetical protein